MDGTERLVSDALLSEVTTLYDAGRFTSAYRRATSAGDLRSWRGAAPRILAGRLAAYVGAPRLSQAIFFRAFREHPEDAQTRLYQGYLLLRRRGAFHVLRWMRSQAMPEGAAAEIRASFLALEGVALGLLRDFERAHGVIDAAESIAPDHAWIPLQRAWLLEREDRIEESLSLTNEILERRPFYHPAVLEAGHRLTQLRRLDEALDLVGRANEELESAAVLRLQGELFYKAGRLEESEQALCRAIEASPLLERGEQQGYEAHLAECAYLMRRYRDAATTARRIGGRFAERFAERCDGLRDGEPPPRIELEVPFVRQHHVTCAPASLASVSLYYGREADHEQIAREVCYRGTPAYEERAWAERQGHVTREFEVDASVTRALLELGHPFTLTTSATTTAHLQVVVGIDDARGTVLIRDPSTPWLREYDLERLLREQAWCGPRGMLMVPAERAEEIAGLAIPGSDIWDVHHRFVVCLNGHRLVEADAELDALRARAPDHRLTIEAALALARYRKDPAAELDALDALLEKYPDTPRHVLARAEVMRWLRPREERIRFLEEHRAEQDPDLMSVLAEDLRMEGRTQDRAAMLLRRAIWLRPEDAMPYHVLADLEASRNADDGTVLELYRFATRLDPGNEHFARAFFDRSRATGSTEEGLAWLERRVQKAGDRSGDPARTFFQACADMGVPERALAVLERAAALRPADGSLAVELVHGHLGTGDLDAASRWLEAAERGDVHHAVLARAAAAVARARGDLDGAVARLERAIGGSPRDPALHSDLCDVLYEASGPDAVLAHLEASLAATPDDPFLLARLCEHLRYRDDARAQMLLEAELARHPDDQWARRELALALNRQSRTDEAIEKAAEARRFLPHDAAAWSIEGNLLLHAGRAEDAKRSFRRAIELDIDNAFAISGSIEAAGDAESQRAAVRFVLELLKERVSSGHGLREAVFASRVLPHEERVSAVRSLLTRHPDVPDAWNAAVRALMDAGDLDGASALLEEARPRFPHWAPLHKTRADVAWLAGDAQTSEHALHDALRLEPYWSEVRLILVGRLRGRGESDAARALLQKGRMLSPRDAQLATAHARSVWDAGEREEAFETLFDAVHRDRLASEGSFHQLVSWGRTLGATARIAAMVDDVIASFPTAALYRLRRSEVTDDPEERIGFLRDALRLNRRLQAAADLLAVALVDAGRHAEALDVCPPPEWSGPVPVEIRGRRAWVLVQAGRREEGMAEMRSILDTAPDYVWGRRMLADWCEVTGARDELLEQARALVAQSPNDAVAYTYLGDALTGRDLGAAIEAFERALALEPANIYAASRFFELRLGAGSVEPAEQMLDRVAAFQPEGWVAAWRSRIAASRGDRSTALDAFAVAASKCTVEAELRAALDTQVGAGWGDAAFHIAEHLMATGEAADPSALGRAWASVRSVRPSGSLRFLGKYPEVGAGARVGVGALIELAADHAPSWVRWQIFWRRTWLRGDDITWGAVGYALLRLRRYGRCAAWLRDFRTRAGRAPWMLLNLTIALWSMRRGKGAREVVADAVALPPDFATPQLWAWEALHRSVERDVDGAREALGASVGGNEYSAGLAHLASAIIEALACCEERLSTLFERVVPILDEARRAAPDSPEMRAARSAAIWAIARTRPWWQRLWAVLSLPL